MKNLLLVIICLFGFTVCVPGQCPSGNLSFLAQFEVDNFAQNYPNCTDLEDGLYIGYYVDSLSGLSQIESIAGNVTVINDNVSLSNFSGLDNVTYIGGDMNVGHSGQVDFTGLGSLATVEGAIIINSNSYPTSLTSLTGLENLTTAGGIDIEAMPLLTDIGSLSNLSTLNGSLRLAVNYGLTNLAGLEGLTSIGESLIIIDNNSLVNLNGLNNITTISGSLTISNNDILVNLAGLNSLNSIEETLLLSQNDALINLTGLESLTSIGSNLIPLIGNPSLNNLNGLNNLLSVGGFVSIGGTQLISLDGLESLTSIGGNLSILNTSITNLSGLENLNSIGSTLNISNNPQLTSLSNLSNLNSIGQNLIIGDNSILTSLNGLGNINPVTITELKIEDSPNLSICEVNSICAYLGLPNSISTIANNTTGCNSETEINNACNLLPVNEVDQLVTVSIQPNPVRSEIMLESIGTNQLEIYNHLGRFVKKIQIQAGNNSIDLQDLTAGVYLFKLNDGETHRVLKL